MRARVRGPHLRPWAFVGACLAAGTLAIGTATAVPSGGSAVVPAPPNAPDVVLAAVDGEPAPSPAPDDTKLVAQVTAALGAASLGRDVSAVVLDALTGEVVLSRGGSRPQTPASTLKTLTGVTALRALGADTRLATTVVAGRTTTEIVLVGGGDATLTRVPAAAADAPAGQSAQPASLSDLATRTATALRATGVSKVTLRIDDSAFTGPRTSPGWPKSYVSTGVVSPVSALSVDGGRVAADSRVRDADPALAAGTFFATRLRAAGLTVDSSITRVVTTGKPVVIASVQSPTVADLVERALTESDNDLAEALAHLAGGAVGGSASFAGGATAVSTTLRALDIPTEGLDILDGSGLARADAVSAETVAGTLAAAAVDAPEVGTSAGVLWPVATGLPIAGVTGTLAERFATPDTRAGRGIVRAKTGTLSGVVTLAGLVRGRSGRLLSFSFLADASPGPLLDAQAALDRAASLLVSS